MPVSTEKRRAFVEFLGKKTVRITTNYKQKTFDLEENKVIDLISLGQYNKSSDPPSNFIAEVEKWNGEWELDVLVKSRNFGNVQWENLGTCHIAGVKEHNFKVTVISDD